MKRTAPFIAIVVSLSILGVVGWGIWTAVSFLWTSIKDIPKEIGVALVAAAATVFVSTLTVVLGRYFERKKELDALYRDKKAEVYDEFLRKLFSIFHDKPDAQPSQDELVAFLRDFMRKLLLWSGPEAVASFVKWKDDLARGTPDARMIFQLEDFLLALRNDLRHSNRGIPKGFFPKLFLKEGNLLLAMAQKNPNVTLAEVAEREKALEAAKTKNSEANPLLHGADGAKSSVRP
jgi:hypothetical protein